MRNLIRRLEKRYNMTVNKFQNDCFFSRKLAWLRIVDELSWRAHLIGLSNFMHQKKEEWIIEYLFSVLKSVIEKFQNHTEISTKLDNAPIWVCWWTGIETAPPLVKKCVSSIKTHRNGHPLIILDEVNYKEYINVPTYMEKRFQNGEIGVAHFCDYLRVYILYHYGGLWLDATIFCSGPLPDSYFDIPFFTCKSNYRPSRYLSHYQWTTFCLGGWKGNLVYGYLKEALELYWKIHRTAIDYLFFDDLIYLGKSYIPEINGYLENVPVNNLHRDDLRFAMNEALPANCFKSVLNYDTILYKLSWREKYSEYTNTQKESVYHYFLNA